MTHPVGGSRHLPASSLLGPVVCPAQRTQLFDVGRSTGHPMTVRYPGASVIEVAGACRPQTPGSGTRVVEGECDVPEPRRRYAGTSTDPDHSTRVVEHDRSKVSTTLFDQLTNGGRVDPHLASGEAREQFSRHRLGMEQGREFHAKQQLRTGARSHRLLPAGVAPGIGRGIGSWLKVGGWRGAVRQPRAVCPSQAGVTQTDEPTGSGARCGPTDRTRLGP